MKSNKNQKIIFKFLKNISYKQRNFFILGTITSLLLLFSFSLSSFFRPYYEHYNPKMNNNVITIKKDISTDIGDVTQYYQTNIEPLFDNITSIDYIYQYKVTDNLNLLYIPSNYNIHNLGYISFDKINNDEVIILQDDRYQIKEGEIKSYLQLDTKFKTRNINANEIDQPNSFIIRFVPFFHYGSDSIVITNQNIITKDMKLTTCYFSITCKNISNKTLSKITKLSTSSGIINPIFDYCIHPGSNYMRFYGLINPIINTLIYVDIILALGIFISTAFTQYLNLKNKKDELRLYLLLGLSTKNYYIYLNLSNSSSYVISNILMIILYVIFMTIFKAIAGYSFYFNPFFLFLYFGLILIQIGIQYLINLMLYKQIK